MLPLALRRTIRQNFGTKGQAWLAAYPSLLREVRQKHGLKHLRRARRLSYHQVFFARHPQHGEVVLKMGVPEREFRAEMTTLRWNQGRSLPQCFDADPDQGWLLMARIRPGTPLSRARDDAEGVRAAARLLRQLWQDPPAEPDLIPLKDWFDHAWTHILPQVDGTIPADWLACLDEFLPAVLESESVLLHGDLHHTNILRSAEGWQAIDPKGLVGPRGYDIAPFLLNPWPQALQGPDAAARLRTRIHLFHQLLGLPEADLRRWGLAHAVLSTLWDIEALGHTNGYALKLGTLLWEQIT